MFESVYKFLVYTLGGSLLAFFFGGWNEALTVLSFMVVLDYLTGLSAAYVEGRRNPTDITKGWNSNKGYWGIFKKFLMFAIIALLFRIDKLLGLTGNISLMVGATYFYIGNELISLLENYGRIGLPMPPQVKQAIRILKAKSQEQEKSVDENTE